METSSQNDIVLTHGEIEELLRCALSYEAHIRVYSEPRFQTVTRLVECGFLRPKDRNEADSLDETGEFPQVKRGTRLILTERGERAILELSAADFDNKGFWPSVLDVRQAQERVEKLRKLSIIWESESSSSPDS